MVQAIKKLGIQITLAVALLPALSTQLFAQQDPPSRVARLNYISGNVSMEPAGVNDWAPADINRPFTIGDYLYTDQGALAELHLDVAVLRMGSQTSFGVLNLDDRTVQLKLSEGDLSIRLRNFSGDQVFEIDTPNAAVTLLGNGSYRFRVDANGNATFLVVRQGQAQVTGGNQNFLVDPGSSANLSGTDQLAYDIEVAPAPDDFDNWAAQRDAHEARSLSSRYLPPTVIGSEDLDDYGSWQNNSDYGQVWYPRNVDTDWAPYQSGHWAWVEPWGYTWVDNEPWGFAPFHYGRWAYVGNRWGWCPGPIAVGYRGPAVRPYYAPALVAWFGGEHWGIGISSGGGPSLGWVPLGFGELYTPPYRCSRPYFNNVNVYNTRVVNNVNITNVYNNVYVNKTVYNQTYVNAQAPHAVVAMSQNAFASGRPVRGAAVAVPATQFSRVQAQAHVVAPPVTPTTQAALGGNAGRPAARPTPQVVQRPVVARNTPPPAPAPFAGRQQFLQQHAGQALDMQAMRQAAPAVRTVVAVVHPAPIAKPVTVRPGERTGNVSTPAAANRSANPQPTAAPVGVARPAVPGAPAGRPMPQPPQPSIANQRPVPAPVQQPAPAAHGVPPNMRPANPVNPAPAQNGTYPNRNQVPPNQPVQRATPPAPQPTPNQPVTRPLPENSRPAPVTPQPARPAAVPQPARPTPQPPAERPQSVVQPQAQRQAPPREPNPPARPPVEEHGQPPQPVREPAPAPRPQPQTEPTPRPQERPAPPPRETAPQAREAVPPRETAPPREAAPPAREAPKRETPPKNDHSTSDHKGR